MENNDEVYIGSISPTIGIAEVRKLRELSKTMDLMLTKEEYIGIMAIYGQAIDRIMKENNMEDKDED
jgi:hypothetical protein